jgi:predicted porin
VRRAFVPFALPILLLSLPVMAQATAQPAETATAAPPQQLAQIIVSPPAVGSGTPAAAQAPPGIAAIASATAPPAAVLEAKPKPWYEELSLNAFVSTGYLYNVNQPSTRKNALRYFDAEDNTFSISVAQISVQKAVSAPGDLGFRADLDFGGVFPERTVSAGDLPGSFDLRQALASWVAPIGTGLRLDAGKFVTPVGYEVIDGYDNYNDNYSRAFLFNYAIPFTHTGAKLSYAVTPQVALMVMVTNGWDSTLSKQHGKTVGGQVALTPIEPLSVAVTYLAGAETVGDGPQTALRHLVDVVATYKLTSWLTVGVNGDYGHENGTSLVTPGANAIWWGGAAYFKVEAPAGYGIAFRTEYFKDEGGTRTGLGTPVTVYEGTVTPFFKVSKRFAVRGEFRIDGSEHAIYDKRSGIPGTVQPTLGVNTVFVF